jgi:hypothetical protein
LLNQSEKAYCQALLALKNKDYQAATEFFDRAAPYFKENKEFNLLRETNRLLIAVKEKLATADHEEIELEETILYGQETELR